jgi:hypothetical protein
MVRSFKITIFSEGKKVRIVQTTCRNLNGTSGMRFLQRHQTEAQMKAGEFLHWWKAPADANGSHIAGVSPSDPDTSHSSYFKIVQLRLSGISLVKHWKLSNVTTTTAVAIFRVNMKWLGVSWELYCRAGNKRWVGWRIPLAERKSMWWDERWSRKRGDEILKL